MPYWRLSGFYFFYFASLGAMLPFWGLYLQDRGYSPAEIGELMAVIMVTKLIAPNIWGWIADHTGRRMPIVRLASLFSVICFIGVFFVEGYWALALVMMLFSFFWNASLPQFEAVTMSYLHERIQHYSRIRLWGSVGFILAVLALGFMLEHVGSWTGTESGTGTLSGNLSLQPAGTGKRSRCGPAYTRFDSRCVETPRDHRLSAGLLSDAGEP